MERFQDWITDDTISFGDWVASAIDALKTSSTVRFDLARAFATEADLLLMDEPFSRAPGPR